MNNEIKITLSNDNSSQTLILSKDKYFSFPFILRELPENMFFSYKFPSVINGPSDLALKLQFLINNDKVEEFYYLIVNDGIIRHPNKSIQTFDNFIQYFSNNISVTQIELAEYASILDLTGNKDKITHILHSIEHRIKDISVIQMDGTSSIFLDLGLKSKLPINILGGGIYKLAQIALTMLARPGSILLIDEIEDGFHYDFFPNLWKIIGKLALETKCQLFSTTHSLECINATSVLLAEEETRDLIRYIRLDNINGDIKPIIFSNEQLEFAINSNIEVR
jgi:hypothetical protein